MDNCKSSSTIPNLEAQIPCRPASNLVTLQTELSRIPVVITQLYVRYTEPTQ
jgi:hypothetical protein